MMSAPRLHPSLPAPVVHAGFSISQSKSHVLAGVQDAYWSDDEAVSLQLVSIEGELTLSVIAFVIDRATRSVLCVLRKWIFLT